MAARRSAATTETTTSDTTTEYQVWYDAVDEVRRSANATDEAGVQQVIADLHADENRRQLLAQSVGLSVPPHEHNFEVFEVTVTTTSVPVPAVPPPDDMTSPGAPAGEAAPTAPQPAGGSGGPTPPGGAS